MVAIWPSIPCRCQFDYLPIKKEYVWAVSKILPYNGWKSDSLFIHSRTNSKVPRTRFNPLFAVNYIDRQIRKDLSEHVRETTRFAKRLEFSIDRMIIYLVYHNYFKCYRESGRLRGQSHAEMAGIDKLEIETLKDRYFKDRVFCWKLHLADWMISIWNRLVGIPILPCSKLARHLMIS